MNTRRTAFALGAVLLAAGVAACGDDESSKPVTLTLVTYDSFPAADTSLNAALATFTEQTGIGVTLAVAGDAGTMVSKAALTAGNPEGDVMWGVDNTLLSRALAAEVFDPYASKELAAIDPALTALVPGNEATPVDSGDVCLNYDIAWFAERGLEPPATLADLTDPAYRDLLVVQNPASSSPGLAFLLATVASFGTDGWQQYWADLRANGVEVVDSWTTAYYERFSGSSGKGPRPLVVSYATSPPAEVLFADPPRTDAPTASIEATCFRQVEFAGVLRGTKYPEQAKRLVDFLTSVTFQNDLPLTQFVYPVHRDATLPDVFVRHSLRPDTPLTLDPARIAAGRTQWLDTFSSVMLR